jgi:hypothetical protein
MQTYRDVHADKHTYKHTCMHASLNIFTHLIVGGINRRVRCKQGCDELFGAGNACKVQRRVALCVGRGDIAAVLDEKSGGESKTVRESVCVCVCVCVCARVCVCVCV